MYLIKDPLVHFLVIGAILFSIMSALSPAPQAGRIIVDREGLLTFLQYRSRAFEASTASVMLDKMTLADRTLLVNDFIREEALYREARALGLDEGDYVIRKRMVQKLEFISESTITVKLPDEDILLEYYARKKEDYYQQPDVTFAHVFVSTKAQSTEAATMEAILLLDQLKQDGADFSDAISYGERFLYHTNYVERTYDFVRSHFGEPATKTIFSNKIPLNKWSGPLMSDYGAHLVYIIKRTSGGIPPFLDIRDRIIRDIKRDRHHTAAGALINEVVGNYTIVIAPDIMKGSSEPSHAVE